MNNYWYMIPITTLIAAFVGPLLASLVQRDYRQKEEAKKNITNARLGIFTLVKMKNELNFISKVFIDKHRMDKLYWLNISCTQLADNCNLVFDVEKFIFLTDFREPELLCSIIELERDFHQVVAIYNKRLKLYDSCIRPIKSKMDHDVKCASKDNGDGLNLPSSITVKFEPWEYDELKMLTDNLIYLSDIAICNFENLIDKYLVVVNKCYPEKIQMSTQRK